MIYTGLEMFMEKLRQLIYSDDYPLISNHLSSISPLRPLLQQLYEELYSAIQNLFTENENRLHELEEVTDLKKRFKELAEEAHDRVDLLLSDLNLKHKKSFGYRYDDYEVSLNLGVFMESIKSIKKELNRILNNTKMDSSPKTRTPASAGASSSRISLRSNNRWGEVVVGLDDDAKLIVEKLMEDEKRRDVVSVVGMGGIGKTTLATKVFNDPFVVYHFNPRVWVTVSQKYEKEDLLIEILASIGTEVDSGKVKYPKLREMLHKRLMDHKFLVVIDDIWNAEAWDDLNVLFPENHKGSRILLTSRLKEVGLHAKRNGLIHELKCLTNEESWEFLRKNVFHGKDCPESLIKYGIRIAKGCHGLPLALVVIAGVLAKEESEDSWERIAQNVTSYIVNDPNRHIQTLALSIDHLPRHLKDCFLYLGGFPEDHTFCVRRLIWLLVAEGFIQEGGNQSLEETAKDYLMELVDRNLVVVQSRKFNGDIKTCAVHDVLRELCIEIAMKERFFIKKEGSGDFKVVPDKTCRVFTDHIILFRNEVKIRSFLAFGRSAFTAYTISKCFHFWMLLMVLDLQQYQTYFPEELSLLLHLRYLAILYNHGNFPSTICNLFSLQTLIIKSDSRKFLLLPNTISNLVNLRHFWYQGGIFFPSILKPMNLQTISNILASGEHKSWVKYFPNVKKISCLIYLDMDYDFKSLTSLETLKISPHPLGGLRKFQRQNIMFPVSLKELTLEGCCLPWICMSKIQSLPKLEVLILLHDAFVGTCWEVGEGPFQHLKFLKLCKLDIKKWEASSINFPCLKQLVLECCLCLEEVPMEIGYIPTLELIKINTCNLSVVQSVKEIEEEQHADGNFDIKFDITKETNYSLGKRRRGDARIEPGRIG